MPYEIGFDPVSGRIDCSPNETACARRVCSCDEQLAYSMTQMFQLFNPEYFDANGFDHAGSCVKPVPKPVMGTGQCDHTEEVAMKCCGEYPYRFPFNNRGGCISCCGAKTFNINKKTCCSGALEALGMC